MAFYSSSSGYFFFYLFERQGLVSPVVHAHIKAVLQRWKVPVGVAVQVPAAVMRPVPHAHRVMAQHDLLGRIMVQPWNLDGVKRGEDRDPMTRA